jgi:hypothetical protein
MGQKGLKQAGLGGYLPETPVVSRAGPTGDRVSRHTARVKPDTQEIRRQYGDEVCIKLNSSRKARTIALGWFLVCVPALLGQVQPPLRIGPFGGIPESLAPIKIPRELEPFVPNGCVLRAAFRTRMAAEERLYSFTTAANDSPLKCIFALSIVARQRGFSTDECQQWPESNRSPKERIAS